MAGPPGACGRRESGDGGRIAGRERRRTLRHRVDADPAARLASASLAELVDPGANCRRSPGHATGCFRCRGQRTAPGRQAGGTSRGAVSLGPGLWVGPAAPAAGCGFRPPCFRTAARAAVPGNAGGTACYRPDDRCTARLAVCDVSLLELSLPDRHLCRGGTRAAAIARSETRQRGCGQGQGGVLCVDEPRDTDAAFLAAGKHGARGPRYAGAGATGAGKRHAGVGRRVAADR
ncbi:hypothetical protein D3C81_1061450 [compost metagenome]